MPFVDLAIALAREWWPQVAAIGILLNHSLMMYRKMEKVHGTTDKHLAAQTDALTKLVQVMTLESRNAHGPILHALDSVLPSVARLDQLVSQLHNDVITTRDAVFRIERRLGDCP